MKCTVCSRIMAITEVYTLQPHNKGFNKQRMVISNSFDLGHCYIPDNSHYVQYIWLHLLFRQK